jgi:flagellar basal body-associated protein FliL
MATGGSKKLAIVLLVVLVFVMLGSSFFIYKLVMAKSSDTEKTKEVVGPKIETEEFTTNFSGYLNHFIVAKFALEVTDEKVKIELEEKQPDLKHAINLVLMAQTEEVLSSEGKINLQNSLREEINKFLTKGEVKKVYILKFMAT